MTKRKLEEDSEGDSDFDDGELSSNGWDSVDDFGDLSSHEEDDAFEVERILAEKLVAGETSYLVKWQGYPDDRSTWETADQFDDLATITEWKAELANGDTLQMEEIQALDARILQKQMKIQMQKEKKEEWQRSQTRTNAKAAKKVKQQIVATDRSSSREKNSSNRKQTPDRTSSPKRQTIRLVVPVQPHTTIAAASTSKVSQGALPKFHGIEKSTNKFRAISPNANKQDRAKPAEKFQNLRHMNNAQKKSMEEPPPSLYQQRQPIVQAREATTRELAHDLPPIPSPDGSPLFFPDPTDTSKGKERSPEMGSRLSSIFASPPPSGRDLAPPQRNPLVPRWLQMRNPIRRLTGRQIAPGELLVQLRFGNHDVGDVLLLNLPDWLRGRLKKLKTGKYLYIDFDEDLVLGPNEFSEATRVWKPGAIALGAVKPHEDNRDVVYGLAQHLEQHDVAAIWEHPEPTATIGMVLYSPLSKSWGRHAANPQLQGMPLVLEARNRSLKGVRPAPIRPKQPSHHTLPIAAPSPPPISQRFPEHSPPPAAGLSSRPLSLRKVAEADEKIMSGVVIESPYHSTDPRKRAATPQGDEISEAVTAVPTPDTEKLPNAMIDWSVKDDFQSLIKASSTSSGKPIVYIAFSEQYPVQATAMKTWAETYTNSRRIYTDADGTTDWDDFRGTNVTALLLFHNDYPNFCTLKEFNNLLGRDNVSCYYVSWVNENGTAKYEFSRLFPRGTVLLLPEWTMIKLPQESIFALEWFIQNCKSKHWKVMVRPNVRAWLQETALQCEDESKAKQLYEILRLLFKLGAGPDVTISQFATHADLLDIGTSRDPDKNNFIVPLGSLPGYDDSPSADNSTPAIFKRDDILTNHFIRWSIAHASSSRKFIALDDIQSRKGKGASTSTPEGAGHIKFWKPADFRRDQDRGERKKPQAPDEAGKVKTVGLSGQK